MRHKVFGRKLNRDYDHRRSLLKNLAKEFFLNSGQIKTTLAKAKAVRPLIEKMVNRAKKGDLPSRRWLYSYFQDQKLVNQVVNDFGKACQKLDGGYTRLVKLKRRQGDDALIVRLSLVKEIKPPVVEKEEKKSRRGKKETKPRGKK